MYLRPKKLVTKNATIHVNKEEGVTRVPVGGLHVASLIDTTGDGSVQRKADVIHVVCTEQADTVMTRRLALWLLSDAVLLSASHALPSTTCHAGY